MALSRTLAVSSVEASRVATRHVVDANALRRRAVRRAVQSLAASVALVGTIVPLVMGLSPQFALAVPASVLVLLASFERPYLAVVGVLVARTVIDVLWWTQGSLAGVNLSQLASGAVVSVVALLVVLRPVSAYTHPLFATFAIFGLFSGISIALADDMLSMANGGARLVGMVALCFLATSFVQDVARARTTVIVLAISGLLPNAIGLYYYLTNQGTIGLDGFERAFGAYSNLHNSAHAAAAFASFGAFWLYDRGFDRWGVVAAAMTAVALASLYFALVRTPMVGLAVEFVVFMMLERRFRLLAIGVAFIQAALIFNVTLYQRFEEFHVLFDSEGQLDSNLGSGRWGLWSEVVSNFFKQPFFHQMFGMGLNQQVKLSSQGWDTHNDYLGLLAQSGPASLIAYLIGQFLLFRGSWRLSKIATDTWTRRFAHFMIAYNAGVTVMNVISNSYTSRVHVQWFFWALAGVIFGLLAAEERKRRAPASGG
jgi:hypothetical protein